MCGMTRGAWFEKALGRGMAATSMWVPGAAFASLRAMCEQVPAIGNRRLGSAYR